MSRPILWKINRLRCFVLTGMRTASPRKIEVPQAHSTFPRSSSAGERTVFMPNPVFCLLSFGNSYRRLRSDTRRQWWGTGGTPANLMAEFAYAIIVEFTIKTVQILYFHDQW